MAFTRTRRTASSSAVTSVSIARPALAEQYAAIPAPGWRALSEVIEMIEPPSATSRPACSEHEEAAGEAHVHDPPELLPARSATRPSVLDPALFTTRSSRPSCSTDAGQEGLHGRLVGDVDRRRAGQVGDVDAVAVALQGRGDGRADAGGTPEDRGDRRMVNAGCVVRHVVGHGRTQARGGPNSQVLRIIDTCQVFR